MDNFIKILENCSKKIGDKVLFKIKEDNDYLDYSYSESYELIKSISKRLINDGIKKGDKIALFGENSPEWVISYFGIHGSGATVVPLDIQYGKSELITILPFANIDTIFTSTTLYDEVISKIEKNIGIKRVIFLDKKSKDNIFEQESCETLENIRKLEDDMSLIFTSGTTGEPKGVLLSDKNLISNTDSLYKFNIIDDKDIILSILPLHHCYAFTATILLPIYAGATIVFQTSLKGSDIIKTMGETGITKMTGVPQLFSTIEKNIFEKIKTLPPLKRKMFNILFKISEYSFKISGVMIGNYLFKDIRKKFGNDFKFFVSGGAKLDSSVAENLSILGIKVLEGYGLTETSPVITLMPKSKIKIGSCGVVLPNIEIKIINKNKNNVGEIIVRGPNVMKGYYKNKSLTNEVVKDGWFWTGDLGYIDNEGYLFITGRIKEVIVLSSGKNIYPQDVEKHYLQSSYISEICVLGKEDCEGKIDKLSAIIVPDYNLLTKKNIANCSYHIKKDFEKLSLKLPTYMRIKEFKIVSNELPKTRLGKLKRNIIKNFLEEELEENNIYEKPELTEKDISIMKNSHISFFLEKLKVISSKKEFHPSDNLELDLGIDSLLRLELLVILENDFSINLSAEEASTLIYLEDIFNLILEKGKSSSENSSSFVKEIKKEPDIPLEKKYNLKPAILEYGLRRIVHKLLNFVFKYYFKLEIIGGQKLPKKGKFLICSNHVSYLDPLIIFSILPKSQINRIFFIALDEMFGGKFLSYIVKMCKIIITGTENSAIDSFRYSNSVLKNNFILSIFPEGQRTIDGEIEKPKRGFSIMACENMAPIYPIYIDGAINSLSKLNPGFHKTKLKVVVGDPIYPENHNEYENIMKKWYLTLLKFKKEYK